MTMMCTSMNIKESPPGLLAINPSLLSVWLLVRGACFAVPLVPIASAAARQAFSARFTALVKAVQKKPAPPPIPGCDNPEVRCMVWYSMV